jgi:hypothetical protein
VTVFEFIGGDIPASGLLLGTVIIPTTMIAGVIFWYVLSSLKFQVEKGLLLAKIMFINNGRCLDWHSFLSLWYSG